MNLLVQMRMELRISGIYTDFGMGKGFHFRIIQPNPRVCIVGCLPLSGSKVRLQLAGQYRGSSYHQRLILELEWEESCGVSQVQHLVPVNHKTDVLGFRILIRDKFGTWTSNGCSVKEIWSNSKGNTIHENRTSVPHKILRKNRNQNIRIWKLKYKKVQKDT